MTEPRSAPSSTRTTGDNPADWALILGVSGSAGGAIARAIAVDPGLHVVGVHRGRWPEEAAAVERDIAKAGRRSILIEAEAGTAEAAEKGVDEIAKRLGDGRIKLFVHAIANASLGVLTGPNALKVRQFEKTFDSMAHSFVHWTRGLHDRGLLSENARIVGLTNPMADSLLRNAPLIAATKAALEVYAKHLAWELGPEGHRVNLVKYGGVITPAVRQTFDGIVDQLDKVTRRISPAGRMVCIEEVADLVTVLAGPKGAWFNGAVIDFTGGEFQSLYDALIFEQR